MNKEELFTHSGPETISTETQEGSEHCPCCSACPINIAIATLGGKWKLQIICALYNDGATRFNALKRKLLGISNAALTNALKELESDGLINRIQFNEIPPHVEYEAAPCCTTLMPIINELCAWNLNRYNSNT